MTICGGDLRATVNGYGKLERRRGASARVELDD